MRRRSLAYTTLVLTFAIAVAGCTGTGGASAQPPSASASAPGSSTPSPALLASPSLTAPASPTLAVDPIEVVVIGDSVPYAAFCPGCTGFVEQYATALEARTGRPVEVENRSRNDSAGMTQIKLQVTKEERLRREVASADIVVVSVGFNNALPDPQTQASLAGFYDRDFGCVGDMGTTIRSYVDWALTTTPECRQTTRDAYAWLYDVIFGEIVSLRAGRPTVLIALNVYDANLQGRDFQAAGIPPETLDKLWPWMIDVYDQWNTMECERAAAHGFACVDLYHAFNGPDGDQSLGALTVDGAHPSQKGNDLIAALLAEVDIDVIAD